MTQRTPLSQTTVQCCSGCGRGWRQTNGRIGCGAGVDRSDHPNPIWAIRKYSIGSLATVIATGSLPQGSDCDNMDPADGRHCKAWLARGSAP
jgi:hypothetical protein